MATSGSSIGGAGVRGVSCSWTGTTLTRLRRGGTPLEPPLDLGTVPVAEIMKDNLKSYIPRCKTKDP